MLKNRPFFLAVLITVLLLSGCNLPQARPTDLPLTVAAQTIQAEFTRQAANATPAPPVASLTPLPPTDIPTQAPSPTYTPTCDLAAFISDVSVPDGTPFLPGQAFTKTWRLKNIGVCTWSTSYQLIFDSGEIMGGPATQALAGSVAPGQTIDVSVNLKAPINAGAYRGYWKLRNAAGVLLPIASGYEGVAFFVDIKVTLPTATITLTVPAPTTTATPTATPTNP